MLSSKKVGRKRPWERFMWSKLSHKWYEHYCLSTLLTTAELCLQTAGSVSLGVGFCCPAAVETFQHLWRKAAACMAPPSCHTSPWGWDPHHMQRDNVRVTCPGTRLGQTACQTQQIHLGLKVHNCGLCVLQSAVPALQLKIMRNLCSSGYSC